MDRRRRTRFVDAPSGDFDQPRALPDGWADPPTVCTRRYGGPWWHFQLDGEVYRYAGTCVEVGHGEPPEHECCCGQPDCRDFERSMAERGIPLDELERVEVTMPLRRR